MTERRCCTMALRVEQDIFVVRQRGREVAAAVGLEHQDQVRIATALSEVARDLLRDAGGADVTFALDRDAEGRRLPAGRPGTGAPAARRPVRAAVRRGRATGGHVAAWWTVEGDTVVTDVQTGPGHAQALTPERLGRAPRRAGRSARRAARWTS